MLLPGLIQQAIDKRKIVSAFLGFDQLPTDRSQHGVQPHGGQFWPHGLHMFQAGRRGVRQLASQHQEGFAVHNELGRGAAFFQMRRRGRQNGLLSEKYTGLKARKQQQNWQRRELDSHNETESTTGFRRPVSASCFKWGQRGPFHRDLRGSAIVPGSAMQVVLTPWLSFRSISLTAYGPTWASWSWTGCILRTLRRWCSPVLACP